MRNLFQKYTKRKLLLVFLDFVLIYISFALALKVKYLGASSVLSFQNIIMLREWVRFLPFPFLMVLYFRYANLYKCHNITNPTANINLIAGTIIKSVCAYVACQLVINHNHLSSEIAYHLSFAPALCILLISARLGLAGLLAKVRYLTRDVIIIGTDKTGHELMQKFSKKTSLYNVVGFIDDHNVTPIPTLGKVKDAKQLAKKHGVQSFILAFDNISRERFFQIFKYFHTNGLELTVSSDYLKILHQEDGWLDIYDEVKLVRFGINDKYNFLATLKKIYDMVLAMAGLIILSPILFIISVLVKLSSPGPVFYSQTRIGKNGKPFKFYKFRSMTVNSDKDETRLQSMQSFISGSDSGNAGSTKVVNKNRITRVGAVLRKYSLDEMPQLFNVLKGDMSLVGPRPCIASEWEMYSDWQRFRLSTIPGCTGIWQVYGRSVVNFEESVLMDIYYNKNFNPWLDVQLMLKTIPVLLFGKGGE